MSPKLSIVVTYYNSPQALENQLSSLSKLPKNIKSKVELVVVDDCSQINPAKPILDQNLNVGLSIRLFRLLKDVPWNHRSARNIGAASASSKTLLLLDIDTVLRVPEFIENWESGRLHEHSGVQVLPIYGLDNREGFEHHHDTLLLSRHIFDVVGGYDENFAGYYGAGPFWLRRAERMVPVNNWNGSVFLEWQGVTVIDSQTSLRRKNTIPQRLRIRFIRGLVALGLRKRRVLSHPFEELDLETEKEKS